MRRSEGEGGRNYPLPSPSKPQANPGRESVMNLPCILCSMTEDGRFWSPAHDRYEWRSYPVSPFGPDEVRTWMAAEHGLEWRDGEWRPILMEPTYVPCPMLGDDPEWVDWIEDE